MENDKRDSLQDFRDSLEVEIAGANRILETFERAGLALTRVEPVDSSYPSSSGQRTWLLFWGPPEDIRQSFDLAPEVLLVLAPWREFQAKDVSAAEAAIRRDLRLDRGVVLVVTRDPKAAKQQAQAFSHTGRLYLVLSFADIEAVGNPQGWLRNLLVERVSAGDLFAAGAPVIGWDFFGRKEEIRSIRGRLFDGRPVGIYGLRKVGKTSVLKVIRKQIVDDTIADGGRLIAIPIHLDLLTVSFAEMNRAGLMRRLLIAMIAAIDDLGLEKQVLGLPASFTDIKRLSDVTGIELERRVPEALERLIVWANDHEDKPIVLLFIDEYEKLLSANSFPRDDGLGILEYLRGLVQTYPKRFNFLIAGLNRRLAATSRFGERQNPLFNFVADYPLAGLEREEMKELVKKIGRRLSLKFEPDALSVIWEETGGHPYLTREYGRVIDRVVPATERLPKVIDRHLTQSYRDQFRQQVRLTMEEIYEAILAIDRGAADVLAGALGAQGEAAEWLAMLKPEVVDALRRYGILSDASSESVLRIGCFGAWLLDNHASARPAVANG